MLHTVQLTVKSSNYIFKIINTVELGLHEDSKVKKLGRVATQFFSFLSYERVISQEYESYGSSTYK